MKYAHTQIYICLLILSVLPARGQNPKHWQYLESVEDICLAYPERMETFLQQVNLESPGLEPVKTAFEQNQLALAYQRLLDYYRDGTTASFLRIEKPKASNVSDTLADQIVRNVCTFYNRQAVVPHKEDGHLDWAFHGPDDDIEWAWALNRHYHIQTLFDAYLETGNPLYAQTIDMHIKDWVIASLPYPAKKSNTEIWRGLEVSFRAKTWAKVFFGLINSGYLSPATQLLLLSSIPEHAHYMKNFHAGGNWLTMEMSGLATITVAWPELNNSPQWFQYAVSTMTKSLDAQVYPDGVQTELSASYHHVALSNFNLLLEICLQADKPLPQHYASRIEDMWNYLAYTMRPDGFGLLNNDSDQRDWRDVVGSAAAQYQREDWKYIITNGKEGTRPKGEPSILFPWAGHLIMRSGYDPDAHWAFFDIGPWGTGHQHNDKLHLSVAAYGRDFLVDGGRFAYRGEVAGKFRAYALSTASHNVILVDGQGQAPGPALAKEPLPDNHCNISADFDHAWHSSEKFKGIAGDCTHSRSLLYVRGQFWVVVDKITTDRPRTIETLWHWHPECRVSTNGKQVVTARNGQGFLHVIPLGPANGLVNLVKGQEQPDIQGWYSKKYNEYESNTVSIYKAQIQNNATFVWILFPSEKQTVKVQAKLIAQNEEKIVLQVNHPGGRYRLDIPFADSNKASIEKQ